LGAGIVPADGIVSFTYNSSVTSGNNDNIRSLLHNFLVGASASGAVNLGVNGNYHIKVKAGDEIAFRISYSNTGTDVPTNTVNVRGVVTNFRYHVNNANDTGIICPGSSYTVNDPVIASSNVPSTWRWAILSGAGSFSSSSVLTGSGVVPSNPTYNSVGGDAGSNVVLLFEATRTGGACDQRKDSALVVITVRPTLVPPTVVGGQDRIRCYSTSAGTMVATPASGGSGPYEYLWQYRAAATGSWVNIDGSNTLVLNHTMLLTQSTEYRILVTDLGIPSCGTLVPGNGIVLVTVLDALNAPVFSPNVPEYLYRCPGTTLSLSVLAASGGHNVFDYTWQYIDSAAVPAGSTINDPNINTWPWQSIVGSISLSPPGGLSYVVPSLPSGTTRYYRVVARDRTIDTPSDPNCGSAWSRAMKVSYLDVVAPIIRPVRQIRVYLGSNGQATYDCSNAANLDSASTDNCGEAVRDFRLTRCTTNSCPVFTCPAGLDTVCLSGSDASGNIGTSTIQVVKLDTIKPVAIAQDTIEVFLNAAGVAVISNAAIANNGSTDNCNALTYSISPTTYRCSDLFGRLATFTVTDASGNSSSDVLWVKVTDRIAPISVPKVRVIGLLDSFGLVSNITPGLVDSLSSDNCAIVDRYILNDTFGLYNNNYSCADLDNIRLGYLVVVDTSGNRDTAAFEILVKDFFAPAVLSFPASTIFIRPNDDCQVLFYWQNGLTYADNCGGAVTLSQPVVFHNGSAIADSVLNTPIVLLSRGIHFFDFTLTDIRGNSRRYRHTIEVIDTIQPRILNCPVGASLVTSAWECGARYFWTEPSATDNCSGLTMTSTHASGSLFPVGSTVVTYNVVDASGRSTSCSFVVVVVDNTPPTVSPRNQNLYLNATGTVTVNSSTLVTASDNCAQSITYNPPTVTFNCSNRGINTRLITVSDGTNQASTNVSVSVFDSIRPVIGVRQNIVVTLNAAGLGVLTVAQVDSNSSDNCAVVVRRLSNTSFSCFDIGIQQVVFTVEDASGNFRDQVVDVLVQDGTPPTVSTVYSSAPTAIVTYLNTAGEVSVNSASLITASDNCGIDSIVPSVLTFNCSNVNLPGQSNIRQVRVRDVNGLSTTINVHVSVRDSIRPMVTSNNRTVILNSSGSTTISAASLVTFSDNCCIGAITAGVPAQANVTFGCTNVGINTVAVTVNDCNGNSSVVNVQVVVADTTSPVLTITNPSPRVVYLDAQCGATLASSQLVSANDACAPVVLTPANHFFNAANCGDTVLVTITARDVNQNSSSIVVPVRVIDTIRPVANFVPQNISVGQCNSVVTFDNPTGFDNCGSVVVTQTSGLASGSSFPVGVTTNVFRLTDNCGNFRDVSFTVTVNAFVLNYNPTNYVVCSLDSSITLSTVSGVTLVGSGVVGNLFYPTRAAIGINVISWSYVDAFGCDTSGTFTVEVLESPALPEIIRETSTLLKVSQPFNAYQWYRYGGLIPGATSRDYNVTLSGVYTVRVMGPSGCYRMSNPIGMGVGVGIEELNAEGINLYPNPNSGLFTLSIEDYDDKSRDMVVLDMTGRQVFRDEVKMGIQQFNLSHLAQGRYIVRIMGDRGLSMKSLIINY